MVPSSHFGEKYDAAFMSRLEAEAAKFHEPIDLEKTLDAIDFNRGWDPADITTIEEVEFDKLIPLLTEAKEDRLFARRLRTLLKTGDRNDATANGKKLRQNTIEWLKNFAATDPVSALRVRRFLPADPPPDAAPSE
ncbi:MAG: hypothetical protein R3E92_21000 [Burkholderiaceae bacterium]